jgi:hypothetical protein
VLNIRREAAGILDLFPRFVVGWAMSAVNDRHLTRNMTSFLPANGDAL